MLSLPADDYTRVNNDVLTRDRLVCRKHSHLVRNVLQGPLVERTIDSTMSESSPELLAALSDGKIHGKLDDGLLGTADPILSGACPGQRY